MGVIQAAEEKGGFVIGGSENYFDSETVIAGVLLYWSTVLYNQIENALSDDYTPGYVGAGVAEGGVDMVINPMFMENGPAEMVEKITAAMPLIDDARDQIRSGELEVPYNPEL